MQGVLQILTERETDVYAVENRLMDVFGTTDIKEANIMWATLLAGKADINPLLLALATTPSLRQEGSKLLGVPESEVAARLIPPGPSGKKGLTIPEVQSNDLRLKFETYKRAVESVANYWSGVLTRLNKQSPQVGKMSAAVLVEEADGKVTWIFPRATSPVVRALSSCVLHAYAASGEGPGHARQRAIAGGAFASKLAAVIGVALRWYVITAGKIEQIVTSMGDLESSERTILASLLGRYGGDAGLVEAPPKKVEAPSKKAEAPPEKVEAPSKKVAAPPRKKAAKPSAPRRKATKSKKKG
jgi:hypothetical protein